MVTALYTDAVFDGHVTPPGHPERVDRLRAIAAALDPVSGFDRRPASDADDADIFRCHPKSYLERVTAAVPSEGWVSLDADTHLAPGSLMAARHAVGAACAAVDAVVAGDFLNAFIAARPPGHHAETATAMGFCLFGTAAIAAKRALDHHGLSRVAVVDFDVHHGNGTQDLLWNEPRTLFVSSHQMPLFPGTGARHEVGAHNNIINLPLQPMSDGREMRKVYEAEALPALADFRPDLIVISAGFDAARTDPLANLEWDTDDFRWVTAAICEVAQDTAEGRVVSTLEGGYDLDALAAGVAAHVDVLKEAGA
ncbi:MAG: histone deacetylase family protein [Pseudomonadota bacterium]